MERPNENTSLEGFDLDFLFDEGTENFDFLNLVDQFPLQKDTPLLEETRQTANEVPGNEVESEGNKARDMQIQMSRSHNIIESTVIVQSDQSIDTNSEVDAASEDKRSKKRKIDREYRARQKAIKQKQEEELQTLRRENTKLQLELEVAKQNADKHKSKSTYQINDVEEYRIVFELNFPDEVAKRRLMMIAGGFPGITSIKMDTQRKRMTLEGIDIDPLPLRDMLKNICNTKLVSFNIIPKKREDKKEEKKDGGVEYARAYQFPHSLQPYPRPQGPPSLYAHEFAEGHGASSVPRFSFENAATIFFVILLLLLLIRPAVYNDVLFRFMNLFAVFFDAIGHGVRRGQVLMCDIYNLLCN